VIPIYFEGFDVIDSEHKRASLARIHIEVHIVKNFEPGILLRIDVLKDYNIDLNLVNIVARLDG